MQVPGIYHIFSSPISGLASLPWELGTIPKPSKQPYEIRKSGKLHGTQDMCQVNKVGEPWRNDGGW